MEVMDIKLGSKLDARKLDMIKQSYCSNSKM